jgi:uncharacterized NAD-dependent epimerase/dehydratase family protein
MKIAAPYLLFLGDDANRHSTKMAQGLKDWVPEKCVAQFALPGNSLDVGLPEMTPALAYARGARTLVVAATNIGGFLPQAWHGALLTALEAGLDLANGMHVQLRDIPAVNAAAQRHGRQLHDVRHCDIELPVANGKDRSGKRLLMVGTDCALGKKYTALALARALQAQGRRATFRATGQTGILIAGQGIAVDAVKADFIAGAAEYLTPANDPQHWDVVEGQGSLFHPAYSGVSLGLLHGSKPHALVLCHDPTRTHISGYEDYPLSSLTDCMDFHLRAARLVNPQARFVGISLNTSKLDAATAQQLLADTAKRQQLPCVDPIRFGAQTIAAALQ